MKEEIYNQQQSEDIINLEKTASTASKDGELKLTL